MLNIDIIRAWKDEDYYSSLSEAQRSQLPENPVGMVELSDADMEIVFGGGDITGGVESGVYTGCYSQACDLKKELPPLTKLSVHFL